jgi:hypothetical protein
MIATLANVWTWVCHTDTAPAPRPKRRGGPVLIGDIMMARGDQPELLIRWTEDKRRLDSGD